MDQRIRQSLSDPELKRVEDKLNRLRNSPTLKTDIGMTEYQNLHLEQERRYNVLEENEHTKYQNFINNPSNNIVPQPESMKDTPYHSRIIKSFLAKHPDIMQHDISGNLYVLGKKVSDDRRQGSKILHWITHDYSDLSKVPHGTSTVINALRKKGFNINDIGNTYLREHLQKRLQQKREARQQQGQQTTPRGAASAISPRSEIPSSSPSSHVSELTKQIKERSDRMSQIITDAKAATATDSTSPIRPHTASMDDLRRKRKRKTLFDDGRRDKYDLRARHRKKSKDDDDADDRHDRPKKHAKRKTKRK